MTDRITAEKIVFSNGDGAEPVHGYTVRQYHNGAVAGSQFWTTSSFDELLEEFPDIELIKTRLERF